MVYEEAGERLSGTESFGYSPSGTDFPYPSPAPSPPREFPPSPVPLDGAANPPIVLAAQDHPWPSHPSYAATVEDDVEDFPQPAGLSEGTRPLVFESQRRADLKSHTSRYSPFNTKADWELAEWLMRSGMSQKARDEFMKLETMRESGAVPWANNQAFLRKVDALPKGPGWECESWTVIGDEMEEEGEVIQGSEDVELWKRDPVECIRELMGNPAFRDSMKYKPERRFRGTGRQCRVYHEMWTGDAWWEMQKKIPTGHTVAPVILASDKTQLTHFSGNKSAWPVYLTLGNIAKHVRRKPSRHATVLIGYLPVPKLSCFSTPERRSIEGWRLFHQCMTKLLEPLIEAGRDGVEIVCADRHVRRHGLSANPEQLGYKKIWPFWVNLPHHNIFECFTPDILHQLHKGNFKDHLVKWCLALAKEGDIDQRFKAMTPYSSLRHFADGISKVKQWTGTEYKNMEKIFLGVIADLLPPKAVKATQALLDFIHYARYPIHTTDSLARMESALTDYHELKQIFFDEGACDSFLIPKLHAMSHYIDMIKAKGTADGYNTESPERLHIDFAKLAYRASNRVNPTKQMSIWLQRQEAMNKKRSYVSWVEALYTQRRRQRREQVEVIEDEVIAASVSQNSHRDGNPRHILTASSSKSTITEIATTHGAPELHTALKSFLSLHISPLIVSQIHSTDHISVWFRTRIDLSLPSDILYDASTDGPDIIEAHPAKPRTKWTKSKAARYDTALLLQCVIRSENCLPRAGYQACRVRAIFTLPRKFQQVYPPIPLAYVELYEKFRTNAEINTGMWTTKRLKRAGTVVHEVVPLGSIHMSCHLIPRFGSHTWRALTKDTALDRTTQFFLNTYASLRMFSLIDHFVLVENT
ncbi:hypothetical protein SISSUDRAFT_1018989 [Sistotremastrum suecicum HHB10207 ss-3]|uniref:Uncharacterized protein n=1 Tax=Sistotremastrum suecicum HHB10207 ss-3 TaxID=1314776 RepID=A0A166F501_9AGAM|nr:hypothetical protein SISSUDRAFT_1018989 [Sistotremastrum suecicum HHB10207 ss-3]